jgi:hypothetical protein
VGGWFDTLGGAPREKIGRLNLNGSLDTGFDGGASGNVFQVAHQQDGGILVGGAFLSLRNGPSWVTRNHVGRLHSDGVVEISFVPTADSTVIAIAVQTDGKILVGGEFTQLNGIPHNHIGRLTPTGGAETSFDTWIDDAVYALLYSRMERSCWEAVSQISMVTHVTISPACIQMGASTWTSTQMRMA